MKKLFIVIVLVLVSVGCHAQDRRSIELQNAYKQLLIREIELQDQLKVVTRDKERTAGMIIEYTRATQEAKQKAQQEKADQERIEKMKEKAAKKVGKESGK